MRILALLNFYDERPEDLILYVASLSQIGVDQLVAVDGAYALYPDGNASSPPDQRAVLHGACIEAGIDLTLHVPSRPWAGNEPEKRNQLFRLALSVAEERKDWFWVIDTDELLQGVPDDLRARLEGTEHDCAEVTMCDTVALKADRANWPAYFRQRRLFRAQPLHLERAHFAYFTDDGRCLGLDANSEPALALHDVTVWHAPQRRGQARQVARAGYYRARESIGAECGMCGCGAKAVEKLEKGWRMTEIGPVAEIVEMCGACAQRTRRRNEKRMRRLGIDPATVAHRYGKAPAA